MPDNCAKTRYVQHTAYALTHCTGRGNFLFLIQHLFFYPIVTLKDTTSEIVLKVLVKSEIYESLSGMSRMSGKEMLIYCQVMERPVTCGGKGGMQNEIMGRGEIRRGGKSSPGVGKGGHIWR